MLAPPQSVIVLGIRNSWLLAVSISVPDCSACGDDSSREHSLTGTVPLPGVISPYAPVPTSQQPTQ